MPGRLHSEASAYLRQHADNPVEWWPFGDEAFEQARLRDVPVFISVGYAACHWCHVMAHESFEDPEIGRYLADNFVSIKVDREERPDVDATYMAATQAMTGSGGWPMSVFTLPDGRPFYAGTYFPPRPARSMPSFRQVLEAVTDAWSTRRPELESGAGELARHLGSAQQGNRQLLGGLVPGARPDEDGSAQTAGILAEAVRALLEQEDQRHGGLGGAPKFPPSNVLEFLLAVEPDIEGAGGLADRTLAAMALGGIFDQVAGGFARYSVDAAWAVPHFEKMLYDNAQLLRHYARWGAAGDPDRRRLGRRVTLLTADWLNKRLRLDGGAFASSLDADTVMGGRHVEGGTYLWTDDELRRVLGAGADDVLTLLAEPAENEASGHGLAGRTLRFKGPLTPEEQERWETAAVRLKAVRDERPQPARDDKIVAAWNGLAVTALAEASVLQEVPELLDGALAAAEYLWNVHWDGALLHRVSSAGRARGIEGLLEDYACVAESFLALLAATGDERWYLRAERLLLTAEARFAVDGTLRDVAAGASQLLQAQAGESAADPLDNATPSGAATFAAALLSYSAYGGSLRHRELAAAIVAHARTVGPRAPRALGKALTVAHALAAGPPEVAIVGADAAEAARLRRTAMLAGAVTAVRLTGDSAGDGAGPGDGAGSESAVPLLQGRPPGPGGAVLAYVCRNMVCRAPVSGARALADELAAGRGHRKLPVRGI